MGDVDALIAALECFKTNQHKCERCAYNPCKGMKWVYGCAAGQGRMIEDTQRILGAINDERKHAMSDFLKFFDEKRRRFPMHLEIYYSKVMDWCISVTKYGCADDYPNSARSEEDAILVQVQDIDMELAFAKAHVALKEWLVENTGGY